MPLQRIHYQGEEILGVLLMDSAALSHDPLPGSYIELDYPVMIELDEVEVRNGIPRVKAGAVERRAARLSAIEMRRLRAERTRRLRECDWTQLEDAGLNAQKRQEWRDYRQALRDLPQSTPDPANPAWPVEPE